MDITAYVSAAAGADYANSGGSMRKALFAILICSALIMPVQGAELTAPEPPGNAGSYMPEDTSDFAGKTVILITSLPLFSEIIDIIEKFIYL